MDDQNDGGKDREGGFSMKKGKILIVGLIALLMACGLVVAGCNEGCPSSKGNCDFGPAAPGTSYDTCGQSSCPAGANGSPCNCN